MHKITTQNELLLFWQYASQHSDVWASLLHVRIEHKTLGCGTIVKVTPKLRDKGDPRVHIQVLFDEPGGAKKEARMRSKVLALPFVLNKGLLKWLAVPRAAANAFRSSAVRAAQSSQTSVHRGDPPPLPPRKKDWHRFQEFIKRHRIRSLYHFTDSRNLDSIRRHGGLYSRWQCRQRGIRIPAPGGNQRSRRMDEEHRLQDYVRLGFNPCLPMMHVAKEEGRIGDVAILRIDPSVIYLEPTLFSDLNANDRDAWLGPTIKHFERIDFWLATGSRWEGQSQKKRFQAEVLVKGHVPLKLIKNL